MIEEIVREHLKTILDVPVLMEEENKEKKYVSTLSVFVLRTLFLRI